MSGKPKRFVTVKQFDNPKFVSLCHQRNEYGLKGIELGEDQLAEYVYRVVSTKNVIDPPVDKKLLPKDISFLIDDGIDVTIK